eukprot:TRINITY_DN13902_c0_g1_i1.p1 TRINITY_DN13902_c0_g1~~TRINITY_DN13902_c0_g1_i1.p1  ORF type:complete len:407 (-),score=112.55 TRINITY_DN13902_c0_g1_i1:158-1378(-)
MEKENKKIKAQLLKEEKQRIMKLVQMAYDNDPRIQAWKKEEEEKALKIKLERQRQKDAKKQEILERERKAEQEKLDAIKKQEEEKKQAELEKKTQQQNLKNAIKTLRTLVAEKVKAIEYDKFFLDVLVADMKFEDIELFNSKLSDAPAGQAKAVFEECLGGHKKSKEDSKKSNVAAAKAQAEADKNKKANWSPEELSLLAKATAKFPVGTKNRWEMIAAFIGGLKTPDEVLAKAKDLSNNTSLRNMDITKDDSFKNVDSKNGPAGAPKNGSTTPGVGIKKDAPANGGVSPVKKDQPAPPPQAIAKPKESTTPTATDANKNGETEENVWSQTQQKALEEALKKFPSSMDPQERWTKIAECVEGKTKKQCVERFKELRAAVVAQKKQMKFLFGEILTEFLLLYDLYNW